MNILPGFYLRGLRQAQLNSSERSSYF